MLQKLALAGILLALASCASGEEKMAAKDLLAARANCAAGREAFRGTSLEGKLNVDGGQPTPAMMAIQETPTKEEINTLQGYVAIETQCDQQGLAWAAKYASWAAGAQSRLNVADALAYSDLLTGRFSYGLINRRLAEISSQFGAEYAQARSAAMEAANAQSAAQMAAFGAALQGAGTALQGNATPAPNPSVNCTTYALGNTLQTRCQ